MCACALLCNHCRWQNEDFYGGQTGLLPIKDLFDAVADHKSGKSLDRLLARHQTLSYHITAMLQEVDPQLVSSSPSVVDAFGYDPLDLEQPQVMRYAFG